MANFVALKDINLTNATAIAFGTCFNNENVTLVGNDIVVANCFGDVICKFPIELSCRYRVHNGLPEDVYMANGEAVLFDIDYDDEDYGFEGDEEQDNDYYYISAEAVTLIIKN